MLNNDNAPPRELKTTADGSPTFYVPQLNEHYHSTHGAMQESEHVFIQAGLALCHHPEVYILEAGFGTGLNALLSLLFARQHDMRIVYHTFERYPLLEEEVALLDYSPLLSPDIAALFHSMHDCEWEKEVRIDTHFALHKHLADFSEVDFRAAFDLVYFDAFNPDVQPELWSEKLLEKFVEALRQDGILTTYCVKGIVKRAFRNLGCTVERLPGPPGKREMLRVRKTGGKII